MPGGPRARLADSGCDWGRDGLPAPARSAQASRAPHPDPQGWAGSWSRESLAPRRRAIARNFHLRFEPRENKQPDAPCAGGVALLPSVGSRAARAPEREFTGGGVR